MEGHIVPIAAFTFVFGGPVAIAIVAIVMYFRKQRKMYESMVKMVELGKKPEEIKQLFEIKPKKEGSPGTGFIKGGIIVAGVGAGLAAMAMILAETEMFAPSLFLLVLALALVVVHFVTRPKKSAE